MTEDIQDLIQTGLIPIQFCNNCSEKIFLEKDFYKIFGETLFIHQNNNPINDNICNNPVFSNTINLITNDTEIFEYEEYDNDYICGECISKLRPYISMCTCKNHDNNIYVILPSTTNLNTLWN